MKYLTRSDEMLLLAIWRLRDNAYGVTIINEIGGRTGKKLSFGALWVSLDVLAKKGLLSKMLSDPSPERGGKSKIYYRLTPKGVVALQETRELENRLWKGIPNPIPMMIK